MLNIKEASKSLKQLIVAIALLFFAIFIGVIGFWSIEDYSLPDAFYMTIITISTVGFAEVHELSPSGRVFTAFYIIFNLSIFTYFLSVMSRYIFEGKLKQILSRYQTGLKVSKMKNHVIVCGFGRNGSRAVSELKSSKEEFVIIEQSADLVAQSLENYPDYNFIIGDASEEDVLTSAGIEFAKAIISAMPEDSTNVYLTLTARQMNPKIQIISRASREGAESKLYRAGANNVVMPDAIGGHYMATLVTKPEVVEFLNMINGVGDIKLTLEEYYFENFKSQYQGKSIAKLGIKETCRATILGIKKGGHTYVFNPESSYEIHEKDIVIILGADADLKKFEMEYLR